MNWSLVKLSLSILLGGVLFYVFSRGYLISPYLPLPIAHHAVIGSDWIPSLIYGAAITTLLLAVGQSYLAAMLVAGLSGSILEWMQPNSIPGVFDIKDLVALWLGCTLTISLKLFSNVLVVSKQKIKSSGTLIIVAVGGFSAISTSKKVDTYNSTEAECGALTHKNPILMSYEELRKSIDFKTSTHSSNLIGQVKQHGQMLFVQEINQGLHVLNVSDIHHPSYIGFISIPGNTDFLFFSDHLFADSFVDLVELDFNGENLTEVYRWPSIYPINTRQSALDWGDIDRQDSSEVVVGYSKDSTSNVTNEQAKIILSEFKSSNCRYKMPPRRLAVSERTLITVNAEKFMTLKNGGTKTMTETEHSEQSSSIIANDSAIYVQSWDATSKWSLETDGELVKQSVFADKRIKILNLPPKDSGDFYALVDVGSMNEGDPNVNLTKISIDLSQSTPSLKFNDINFFATGIVYKDRLLICRGGRVLKDYGELAKIIEASVPLSKEKITCGNLSTDGSYLYLTGYSSLQIFEYIADVRTLVSEWSFTPGVVP